MTNPIREKLMSQLRKVIDPCSIGMRAPRDIWEMGLIEELEVTDGRVRVSLVLTDVSCVFYRDLKRHIADVLLELPQVNSVNVELVTTTMWTPDRMPNEGARLSQS